MKRPEYDDSPVANKLQQGSNELDSFITFYGFTNGFTDKKIKFDTARVESAQFIKKSIINVKIGKTYKNIGETGVIMAPWSSKQGIHAKTWSQLPNYKNIHLSYWQVAWQFKLML